jgi:hypothetical protein
MKEKQDILAMKVSQLGLNPDESATEEVGEEKKDASALGADELLKHALNRSIEEMVGPSLADYNIKYSE